MAPPPLLSTGDTGSFAEKTLLLRLPAQLDRLLELEIPDPGAAAALRVLKKRLEGGSVRDLLRERPEVAAGMLPEERAAWQRAIAANLGKAWHAIPWYFAESLFYLEILAASGYYDPSSPGCGRDPYEPLKLRELSEGGIIRAGGVLRHVGSLTDPEERLAVHLLHALWGNRVDLTFSELAERYASSSALGGQEELLIDHSREMARRALDANRVDLVLDNAGSELVCDLLAARAVLESGAAVVLHVKSSPFYVSDAMAGDVHAALKALSGHSEAGTRQAGEELGRALQSGSLAVDPHWFWNGPQMYPEWPAELRRRLAGSELILFKGDVNYRRLVGDRRWNPETPMEELTSFVPAPFGVLRTLKSEVVVDLPRETVEALSREDPEWSVRGRYGVARLRG